MKKNGARTLKTLILFKFCLILSACVTTANSQRVSSCNNFANDLGKTKEWLQACYNDAEIFTEGYVETAYRLDEGSLCLISIGNEPSKNLLKAIAKDRGINCDAVMLDISRTVMKKSSIGDLCSMWAEGGTGDIRKIIQDEVNKRDVDCIPVLALEEQKRSNRIQAYNALTSDALLRQTIIQNQRPIVAAPVKTAPLLKTPQTTNCQSDGFGGVRCTTY